MVPGAGIEPALPKKPDFESHPAQKRPQYTTIRSKEISYLAKRNYCPLWSIIDTSDWLL